MKRFTGWTTAFAATALLAGPVAVAAQQTSPAPATSSSASAPQSAATPAQADPAAAAQPAPTQPAQANPETVKRHLTAARDSLSQITQLPAASQLTGDARTQVSQLISNFNELITTTTEWRASYSKVQANLTALIGDQRTDESPAAPATGTPGAVGTSGTVTIDPSIKSKLVEFRSHLMEFEKAAGAAPATSLASSQSEPAASSPSAPTTASTSPSEPAAAATTASGATATTGSTSAQPSTAGTSGTTSSVPAAASSTSSTASAEPDQSRPATTTPESPAPTAAKQSGHTEAMRHIEAIESILNGRATGSATAGTSGTTASVTTLDHDKIEQIKTHLAELRRALAQGGGH